LKILSPYFIVTISSLLSVNSLFNTVTQDHRSAYFSIIAISNDSIALENDYVRVLRNATITSSADAASFDKRILIALSDLTYKSQKKAHKIHRGNVVVFQPNESYQYVVGDFFEVALKKAHPLVKGPDQWIEPLKNTTVYEDEQLRIFEERLEPGDTRELHSHAQRVVIRLNQTQLTDPRFKPNGAPGEGIQVKNTVKFAEPMVHVVKNLSKDVPLFNIIIEFKTSVKKHHD
jgi:hypothetical protein